MNKQTRGKRLHQTIKWIKKGMPRMHKYLNQPFSMTLVSDTKTLGTESSITLQQTNHQTKTF